MQLAMQPKNQLWYHNSNSRLIQKRCLEKKIIKINIVSPDVKLDRTVSDGQGSVQNGEFSNETCLERKTDSENQSQGIKHVQDMHTEKKPEI